MAAAAVYAVYPAGYEPPQASLDWVGTPTYHAEAKRVRVYHDGPADLARAVATEREPVNMDGHPLYDEDALAAAVGYRRSGYLRLFSADPTKLPPTIGVYCHAPLVRTGALVHVFNSIGVALDHPSQPDYQWHAANGFEQVRDRLTLVYRMLFRCAADLGLETVALAGVGSGVFATHYPGDYVTDALAPAISAALQAGPRPKQLGLLGATFQPELSDAVAELAGRHSIASRPLGLVPAALDDPATLYQNAWDPHSMVGNGNAGDRSLDGFFGRSVALHFLCWPPTNPFMQFVAVG